jgi:hypothetical protein
MFIPLKTSHEIIGLSKTAKTRNHRTKVENNIIFGLARNPQIHPNIKNKRKFKYAVKPAKKPNIKLKKQANFHRSITLNVNIKAKRINFDFIDKSSAY